MNSCSLEFWNTKVLELNLSSLKSKQVALKKNKQKTPKPHFQNQQMEKGMRLLRPESIFKDILLFQP